ncbi:hypothetical protein ACFE04_028326 [Oxalis oulophora]
MEYDLGGEGDLFKAPEPIIGEPMVNLDNMTAADIELIQNDQILSDVLYECEKDLMTSSATDAAMSDILDIKIPFMRIDDSQIEEQKPLPDSPFQKSVSSGSLTSMDWVPMKPNFLDFPGMDLSIYGMRRAFSEGDIKTLGNGNVNIVHSPVEQPLYIGSSISECRKEQLSRYRNKKSKRNFGRKIKYACRKALADSQPRVRGRFARTEESDTLKRQ